MPFSSLFMLIISNKLMISFVSYEKQKYYFCGKFFL